uniref:PH domain and leucine rich repeat protein phosphatase 1 n=1 Tax=Eptatretus burgeri TaxID=7764 RepID=A0A8C4NG48_EPTBU
MEAETERDMEIDCRSAAAAASSVTGRGQDDQTRTRASATAHRIVSIIPRRPEARRRGPCKVNADDGRRPGRVARLPARLWAWLRAEPTRACLHLFRPDGSYLGPWLHGTDEAPEAAARPPGAVYVRYAGLAVTRTLRDADTALEVQRGFLQQLGYRDPRRVQEEGAAVDLGCLIRFYTGKPQPEEQQDRVCLSGSFPIRKGRTQLHKWSERFVSLCGTCLIVASTHDGYQGKTQCLPLIGGKVEQLRKRQHCLQFTAAGSQGQTYYVSYNSFAEYLRWLRQASKVVSQRIGSVDLSCCALEELPEHLFYSSDITHLNLRHNMLVNGLNQVHRFTQLQSLNLAHNHLGSFPLILCNLPSLTELNLSCNDIEELPPDVCRLISVQSLILDGNHLTCLPQQLSSLQALSYIGLSFNSLRSFPAICTRLPAITRLCLAGNLLPALPLACLAKLPLLKHVELRMNHLSSLESCNPMNLAHVTQLDLREGQLSGDLDLLCMVSLETLRCDRNRLTSLSLAGQTLRTLQASGNQLTVITISSCPTQLTYVDISRNKLESFPCSICDSPVLEIVDVSRNELAELPSRLVKGEALRRLYAGHNRLRRLEDGSWGFVLESLDLQHNLLLELPAGLLHGTLSLRTLNVCANLLETLPVAVHSGQAEGAAEYPALQELLITGNRLNDKCALSLAALPHLRQLHLAYNHLATFPASKLAKLTELEELNLSGNRLHSVPTTIHGCKHLHTLSVHCNAINVFPEIFHLPEIKLVDLSCNALMELPLPENLPPKLQELDLTGNPRLALDHSALDKLSHIPCLKIDPRDQQASGGEGHVLESVWTCGVAESQGQRKKLCVSSLACAEFGEGGRSALFGVFDGERNVEVPRLMQCTMGDVLWEEIQRSPTAAPEEHICHAFLDTHKKLGTVGQKLGASAVLCHIHWEVYESSLTGMIPRLTLTMGNVGGCVAWLCRAGRVVRLNRHFVLNDCLEERTRLEQLNTIITEDNKVCGVTTHTRLSGCSFLYPSVLPRPHVTSVRLIPEDELLVLGSCALAQYLSPSEAVQAARLVGDPLAAAKRLVTLAQGYGCHENLAVIVIRINPPRFDEDDAVVCCTCEANAVGSGGTDPGAAAGRAGSSSSGALSELSSEISSEVAGSEVGSEVAGSEVSSEVGSTVSDEQPPLIGIPEVTGPGLTIALPERVRCCCLHPSASARSFHRQMSAATFSSAHSDPGRDSSDEEDMLGPLSSQTYPAGQLLEVEADVHAHIQPELQARTSSTSSALLTAVERDNDGIVIVFPKCQEMQQVTKCDTVVANNWGESVAMTARKLQPYLEVPRSDRAETTSILQRIRNHTDLTHGVDSMVTSNGGVVAGQEAAMGNAFGWLGRNGSVVTADHNGSLLEVTVANDAAPVRPKRSAYFVSEPVPALDPDDELIVPPELEEEVKEQMRQYQQQQKIQQYQQQKQELESHEKEHGKLQPDVFDTAL